MILKDMATFQVCSVHGTSLLSRSTVAFSYLKVKSAKCLCLFRWSWSWSCYFGLSLVLKSLVLSTSLAGLLKCQNEHVCTGCVKSTRSTLMRYNFDIGGPIFIIFFTVKFITDLWKKFELKLSPPLRSVAALPCESKWSSIELYIHISENSILHVKRHLLYEFLFVYLFFLPDNDVIVTLLQYFVWSYEDKRLTQHWPMHS